MAVTVPPYLVLFVLVPVHAAYAGVATILWLAGDYFERNGLRRLGRALAFGTAGVFALVVAAIVGWGLSVGAFPIVPDVLALGTLALTPVWLVAPPVAALGWYGVSERRSRAPNAEDSVPEVV